MITAPVPPAARAPGSCPWVAHQEREGEAKALRCIVPEKLAHEVGARRDVAPLVAAADLHAHAFLFAQVHKVEALEQLVRELGV